MYGTVTINIYSDHGLLSCDAIQLCGTIPVFQSTLLPPSSGGGSKNCYTASQTRRQLKSPSPWKPQISCKYTYIWPHDYD